MGPEYDLLEDNDMNDREMHEVNEMNILEFERRVKKYADESNRGFINTVQLMEAFSDTHIFAHLSDKSSMKTKFLLSTFVADFNIGSQLKIRRALSMRMSTYRSHSVKNLKRQGTSSLYQSCVDTYLADIAE